MASQTGPRRVSASASVVLSPLLLSTSPRDPGRAHFPSDSVFSCHNPSACGRHQPAFPRLPMRQVGRPAISPATQLCAAHRIGAVHLQDA